MTDHLESKCPMKKLFTYAALFFAFLSSAFAAVELPSNISATVVGVTSFDNATGLYTYRYSVTNYGESSKPVHELFIPLRGASVLNVTAPSGWEGSINKAQTMVGWCACKEDGFAVPAGYVNDGRGIPSSFALKPGATLSGFSFQSPYPPAQSNFFAGGWVPVPVEGIDFPEGQEPSIPDFPMNLLSGTVNGPLKSDTLYLGGRRPAVDGFLVFANISDGGAYPSPVIADILFSQNGENVLQATFKATLNGVDVTSKFAVIDTNRRRAVFEISAGSPLKVGKNTLITMVDGTVGGSNKKTTDTDRVVFVAK